MSAELAAVPALDVPDDAAALAASLTRARAGALLDVTDMQRIFKIRSPATFFRLQKRGQFDPFRVAFPVGTARYSGVLVWRYLEGLDVGESGRSFFGRKRRTAKAGL
jgi:hypothetical protein